MSVCETCSQDRVVVADWLGRLAVERLTEHGPHDPRGAAWYDASAALLELRVPPCPHAPQPPDQRPDAAGGTPGA